MGQRSFAGTDVSFYCNEMIIHDLASTTTAAKDQSKLIAVNANGTFIDCGKIIRIMILVNYPGNRLKVAVSFVLKRGAR